VKPTVLRMDDYKGVLIEPSIVCKVYIDSKDGVCVRLISIVRAEYLRHQCLVPAVALFCHK
jgi:hypothetical protein